MTKKADEAQAAREDMSDLGRFIHDYISKLDAWKRMYPEFYAEDLAAKVIDFEH